MSVLAHERLAAFAAQALPVEGADDELMRLAKSEALSLSPADLRAIAHRLGRNPTRAEAHAFAIQWSEHCSYKSSRALLSCLPTRSREVLVPVGEDAGVLRVGMIDGKEYGVVIAHESHNHPSQVVPFEGAATGVGGILRDVLCMGAEVAASADPLRFGPPIAGSHAAYVAAGAVDGIASYGNAVGVPNIAGDVYFHPSFRDNCLVNVVALGFLEAHHIIHSRVPDGGVGYDLVLVGKATDASGFGGAAFASLTLDAAQAQANKSAVQVPDPFLKNVLMRASYAVFAALRDHHVQAGFKDLGAGGLMGSSSELCSAGGFGACVDIDKVPQALAGLSPTVIACAETQERMLWAVPASFTQTLLGIYNERFTLPDVSAGACAAVVGKVTSERRYMLRSQGVAICDVPIEALTEPKQIRWPMAPPPALQSGEETVLIPNPAANLSKILARVLSHPDVCSRQPLIEHYDSVVRGATAIPSGYADAGVVIVKRGSPLAVALSVDGNARYGALSAKHAAAHAVVEAARNVAAVGAIPIGLTDCLNYASPEDPVAYRQLSDGIEGLSEAANALTLGGDEPLPFVSGNVSLYNQSSEGGPIVPSAIVACIGRIDDVRHIVTMEFPASGHPLYLFGARVGGLAGSVLASLGEKKKYGPLPPPDYDEANASIQAVIAGIRSGYISAAHDISDGGLLVCLAEMCFGRDGDGRIGARIDALSSWAPNADVASALFGESGGFVVAVEPGAAARFEGAARAVGAEPLRLGVTGGPDLELTGLARFALDELARAWLAPLAELYA
ncbi:MAG: phosphoribosylformylglycinamidine synthase subunit PurL [Candidatus Eremiobacter antarcticus]|nr:phosphoribosylformylglycinamidine synthase subunit PurL [Candidatus Eremiobacteraeota bacterium]MBC5809068.1 phosphoribosylformylglycinamidine synthase subunit PurL [Candidatus Eremiobacteraeota bacterium]PZR64296.1 MAG: phosphoribosylformylglycinamidine synthase subunit PurL [Candidatus Eremiobacter sp. RRmetagenome_bin22]